MYYTAAEMQQGNA